MSELSKQVGLRLRAARITAKFKTAKAFACAHGIPKTTYSQHENGLRRLNVDVLFRYGGLLEINPAWLLTGVSPPYINDNFDVEKEKLLYNELSCLTKVGAQNKPILTTDSGMVFIDFRIFVNIIGEIFNSLNSNMKNFYNDKLLKLLLKIYNQAVNILDKKKREEFIRMCADSVNVKRDK